MPIWPRPNALTMPRVTVEFRPKGFPTASTYSPTCNLVASPQETVGRFCPSIFTTARSVFGSAPTILPENSRLSGSVMVTVRAPSITWWLVRMYPSGETMTPDPCPPPPMRPWLTITLRPTESTRAERCPRSSKELLHPFTQFIRYALAIRHLLDGHIGNVDHGWCHRLRNLRKSIRW